MVAFVHGCMGVWGNLGISMISIQMQRCDGPEQHSPKLVDSTFIVNFRHYPLKEYF